MAGQRVDQLGARARRKLRQRLVAYLQSLRRAGDGEAAAVPQRLGPWREWVPPRGHLFGLAATGPTPDEVPQPRRCDPGE